MMSLRPLLRVFNPLVLFRVVGILCATFSAHAGNEHEHLQYLVSFEDIEKAAGGDLRSRKADDVSRDYYKMIKQRFGEPAAEKLIPVGVPFRVNGVVDEEALKIVFRKMYSKSTFGEVCDQIAQITGEPGGSHAVMRKMFELTAIDKNYLDGYLVSGNARARLFIVDQKLFLRSVNEYVNRVSDHEILKTVFSVPNFQSNTKFLHELKDIYAARKAQVHVYFSMPRRRLDEASYDFQNQVEGLRKGISEGVIDGLDISGSILEASQSEAHSEEQSLIQSRLKYILKFSKDHSLQLRIHAFEAGRKGPFYDALHRAFEECQREGCLPGVIRIGHIQELLPEDIDYFAHMRKNTSFVFEANIESNLKLQASDTGKLIKTIESIHEKGFRVVLGADGAGILGEASSFENTLFALKKAGLKRESLERLMKDAYLPITKTRISKEELLRWQGKRDEMRRRVLGEEYRSIKPLVCTTKTYVQYLKQIIPEVNAIP